MKAQYQKEAKKADLNPVMWNKAADDWAATAWYTLADGTKAIKKFTYGMTRASLQDGPGANAMWNITNVTRSDRRYLYTTDMWAKAMSMDKDVISYIKQNGKQSGSILHPYYGNGTDEDISKNVNMLLGLNAKSDADAYKKHFVHGLAPWSGCPGCTWSRQPCRTTRQESLHGNRLYKLSPSVMEDRKRQLLG